VIQTHGQLLVQGVDLASVNQAVGVVQQLVADFQDPLGQSLGQHVSGLSQNG
jgi:hypothetical protein